MSKIKYVGHPFVDVGVAVMEIYLGKICDEFTNEDIERANKWIVEQYDNPMLKGYLSTIFPNSGWANFNIKGEKKQENIRRLLYSDASINRQCLYCSEPANAYANRQDIPLISGVNLINVQSDGEGIPICRHCLASIQFFPLATLKVEGSALFWYTHSPDLSYYLSKLYYEKLKMVMLASIDTKDSKLISIKSPYTRLLGTLHDVVDIYRDRRNNPDELPITDCIGYHITNYGTSPAYDEYLIPSSVLSFFKKVKTNKKISDVHEGIIRLGWRNQDKKDKSVPYENTDYKSNDYYNALGEFLQSDYLQNLPKLFKYFLNRKIKELNSFELTQLFLTEVMGMNKNRLEKVRNIADAIVSLGNEKIIKELYYMSDGYKNFITYIVKVQNKLKETGNPFKWEDVCTALNIDNEEDATSNDYWLVRDLIIIRMLEKSAIVLDEEENNN